MRGIENGNDGSTIFEKKIFAAFKMQIASLSLVCHLTPKLHQMFKLNLCLYFYSLIGLYFCSVCNDHVDCSEITQLFLRGKVDEKNSQSQGIWDKGTIVEKYWVASFIWKEICLYFIPNNCKD